MTKVSVLIPSYNHSQFINQCIDSVLAQTYKDFEIVVVDDGSTDGSREILRAYGDKILLLEQSNKGTQAARNAAIQASSGEYLALLDSDDVWLPEKLERQVAELGQFHNAGLVYSFAYRIDKFGELVNGGAMIGMALDRGKPILPQMLLEDPVPALTAIFRRACLQTINGFDEMYVGAADWDLWIQIASLWDVLCIPEPLALYREHEYNTTKSLYKNKAIYSERCALITKALDRYGDRLTPDERNAAWGKVELLGARVAVESGNAEEAGRFLSSALAINPQLLADELQFVGRIVEWAYLFCQDNHTGANYHRFVDELYSPLSGQIEYSSRLRRLTLSNATMGLAFRQYHKGDLATVRSVLPVGVQAEPRWLLNRGVWSMAMNSFMMPLINMLRGRG